MIKKTILILFSLALISFHVAKPFLTKAENVFWENYCYDLLQSIPQQDGSVLVRCYNNDVIPTNTPTVTPTVTPTETLTPTPTSTPVFGSKVVNSTNLRDFDNLTQQQISQASNTKMVFMDRSVGQNVSAGLDCLAATTWALSPTYCRVAYTDNTMTTTKTYLSRDLPNVPSEILFPTGMSRANWIYDFEYGNWDDMVRDFIQAKFPQYYNQGYRVISFQFSYLNVMANSSLDEKFFDRSYVGWNIVDLEQLEQQYPDVTLIYWTTSLARTIGTIDATVFNQRMRDYANSNGKYLIDMADIESHDYLGNLCTYNGQPAICRDYTTEPDGGHLGSISNGALKMAKAVWLMMVEISK